ncbi:glycosyltransferase family 4 protein [Algihabitans albus]|uniref:glycosyltransferase family 4 protein n=1 Tax=Algihabitans albus TaxID=2164067 RepID=UPI0013C2B55A|nr:glycosyltransferase family 4 protein [Algihabitans albus]
MKPPDHPVPSGDRAMARLLMRALESAGHEVTLACRLRSREPAGDLRRQARLQALGAKLAHRYATRHRGATRPDLWFTYHLYYKAPDWVGPLASRLLGIPYVVAEASVAPKRAGGAWDRSHRAVLAALDQAALILPVTARNAACLPHSQRHRDLPPFLEAPPDPPLADLHALRDELDLGRGDLGTTPLLITAAMMRPGAKLASYRLLAEALRRIPGRPWTLIVLGDGPARPDVEAAFAPLGARVRFLGEIAANRLPLYLRLATLYLWPAVEEAYGMAILEAMAAGLPAVAGDEGGVATLIENDRTGLLARPRDAASFANCILRLLDDRDHRTRLGEAARRKVARRHSLAAAADGLDAILREAVRTGIERP